MFLVTSGEMWETALRSLATLLGSLGGFQGFAPGFPGQRWEVVVFEPNIDNRAVNTHFIESVPNECQQNSFYRGVPVVGSIHSIFLNEILENSGLVFEIFQYIGLYKILSNVTMCKNVL